MPRLGPSGKKLKACFLDVQLEFSRFQKLLDRDISTEPQEVVGAHLFELVGLKADLGALIIGAMLANHPRSQEIAQSLFGLKEILLVGFFLTIGLSGVPSWDFVLLALGLIIVLPIKIILFYLIL